MTTQITQIVAMASGRVIGAGGAMPWHIPEDFRFFRTTTMGHAMIMGRKTFDAIGRALPGRLSLVVTRQAGLRSAASAGADVVYVPSVAAALAYAAAARDQWGDEVFVIGGGELFRSTMEMTRRIHLTLIAQVVAGDAFYPALAGGVPDGVPAAEGRQIFAGGDGAAPLFACTRREARPAAAVPLTFLTFERLAPGPVG